jgi:hypothetical protein
MFLDQVLIFSFFSNFEDSLLYFHVLSPKSIMHALWCQKVSGSCRWNFSLFLAFLVVSKQSSCRFQKTSPFATHFQRCTGERKHIVDAFVQTTTSLALGCISGLLDQTIQNKHLPCPTRSKPSRATAGLGFQTCPAAGASHLYGARKAAGHLQFWGQQLGPMGLWGARGLNLELSSQRNSYRKLQHS